MGKDQLQADKRLSKIVWVASCASAFIQKISGNFVRVYVQTTHNPPNQQATRDSNKQAYHVYISVLRFYWSQGLTLRVPVSDRRCVLPKVRKTWDALTTAP
jgi:hypothetical protein